MNKPFPLLSAVVCGLSAAAPLTAAHAYEVFEPIVEINATDGDVGFHALVDGDTWRATSVFTPAPDFDRVLRVRVQDPLRSQGITELFFESAEPLCWNDPEAEPGTEVVTVAEFIDRFPTGTYFAFGRTRELDLLSATGRFTHNLPAAPVADFTVAQNGNDTVVTISWEGGTDLGNCAYPAGLIPDPATVPVVRWEVAFETDVDELPEGIPFTKFSVTLPADARSTVVPIEFMRPLVEAGIVDYKFEVGAKEASGNQTFTEQEVSLED